MQGSVQFPGAKRDAAGPATRAGDAWLERKVEGAQDHIGILPFHFSLFARGERAALSNCKDAFKVRSSAHKVTCSRLGCESTHFTATDCRVSRHLPLITGRAGDTSTPTIFSLNCFLPSFSSSPNQSRVALLLLFPHLFSRYSNIQDSKEGK